MGSTELSVCEFRPVFHVLKSDIETGFGLGFASRGRLVIPYFKVV